MACTYWIRVRERGVRQKAGLLGRRMMGHRRPVPTWSLATQSPSRPGGYAGGWYNPAELVQRSDDVGDANPIQYMFGSSMVAAGFFSGPFAVVLIPKGLDNMAAGITGEPTNITQSGDRGWRESSPASTAVQTVRAVIAVPRGLAKGAASWSRVGENPVLRGVTAERAQARQPSARRRHRRRRCSGNVRG